MINTRGYDPETGVWNDSLAGDFLWSSVNTREATPDVMTPFTWSALRYGFARMILLPGYLPVGNICGRVYNNASVGATVFRALAVGLAKNSFEASSKELYGIDPKAIEEWNVPLVPVGPWKKLLALYNTLRVMANVSKALRSIHTFLNANPAWCETQRANLSRLDRGELVRWSNEILMPYLVKCFWWLVGGTISQSNAISKLRGDLLQIVGPDEAIALLSNVSSADEILASLGVVAGLDRLRRGAISREEYMKQYGHRGPHEAELSIPRPAENPNWIDEQLEGLERSPADVDTLLRDQRMRYEAALENLRKRAPRKFDSILQKLREAARLTRLREAGRSETTRALWVSRAFALHAGALCGLDEDVFFLEHEEIIHLLEGQNESAAGISVRKTAYHKLMALPQFPTIIRGQFDPFLWAADPNRRTDVYDTSGHIRNLFADRIKGLPGSAGQAQGRVRILNSPEEGALLLPGEILVAVTTNVGWTPIFPHAAAVVTDVGAPLSHAAIVARELGIPAVVGCFNATEQLKTGDLVRVDGSAGVVELIESDR
ncbi:MAG: PEP-utilizing enzyme [Anaerolineales bacterium]|jgi:phosphohistidine swiveling domain-containing protein